MPKIQRKTQKIFCNSADSDQLAVFGSMSTGTPVYSSDIEELQSNEAFDLGWDAATLEDKAPFMEEMNGVQYGLTYQIAYGLQEGIPEYDTATTYYIGSICKVLEDGKPVLYTSLTDNNIGNDPVNDSTNWERLSFGGGGLEIGDIGFTQMAIDESKGKRRVLNGQLIIQEQYVEFTNIVKNSVALNPDLACTESEWQTAVTMSVNGVCDKFVIDDEAGTIRLPKYPTYLDLSINGAKSVSVKGTGKSLGLTNGSINFSPMTFSDKGYGLLIGTNIFNTTVGTTGASAGGTSYASVGVVTDASKSGLTGSVDTESEQIKGTYFIQVATGAETEDNIVNEIELNNPFSFGDSKYSPVALNNLSWLKSEGQYNAKAVYPAYYDWALTNFNNGVEGFALSTDEYTDYDVVINSAEETFRLPLLNGSESFPSDRFDNVTLQASGEKYVAPANGWFYIQKIAGADYKYLQFGNLTTGEWRGDTASGSAQTFYISMYANRNDNVQLSYDATGTTATFRFIYAQGNGSLYFYVGETVQNANLINAGRIEETLVKKVDMQQATVASFPSSKRVDLTLGASGTTYTAPATGWVTLVKNTGSSQTNGNIIVVVGACEWRTFCDQPSTSAHISVPVAKGQSFKITYNLSGTTSRFRFVYAQGEK